MSRPSISPPLTSTPRPCPPPLHLMWTELEKCNPQLHTSFAGFPKRPKKIGFCCSGGVELEGLKMTMNRSRDRTVWSAFSSKAQLFLKAPGVHGCSGEQTEAAIRQAARQPLNPTNTDRRSGQSIHQEAEGVSRQTQVAGDMAEPPILLKKEGCYMEYKLYTPRTAVQNLHPTICSFLGRGQVRKIIKRGYCYFHGVPRWCQW